MGAFENFVNANLGIRKVLVSDFGPPTGQNKSDKAAGPIGSQYIDLNTGPNYLMYEKFGPNNNTDWIEIRKVGEAGSKPEGPDTSLQFASGEKLGGSSHLTYDYESNLLEGTSGQFKNLKVLGDLHILGTSYVHEIKDTTIEGTISGYTGKFSDLLVQDKNILDLINGISGNLISTGSFLESEINTLSGESTSSFLSLHTDITATGQLLSEDLNSISGELSDDILSLKNDSIATFAQQAANLNSTGYLLQEEIDAVSGNLISTGSFLESEINTLSGESTSSFLSLHTDITATGQLLLNSINNSSNSFLSRIEDQIDSLSGDLNTTGLALSKLSGDLINLESQTLASLSQQSLDLIATGQLLSSNLNGASSDDINTISGDLINLESQTLASFVQQSSELSATGQLLNSDIHLLSGTLQNSINLSSGNATANSIALFDDTQILDKRVDQLSGEHLASIVSLSDDITLLDDNFSGLHNQVDLELTLHSGQNLADKVIMSLDIAEAQRKLPLLSSLPIPQNTIFMAIEYIDISSIIKYQFTPQVSTSVRIDDLGANEAYFSSVYKVSETGFYVKFNSPIIESNNILDICVYNKA